MDIMEHGHYTRQSSNISVPLVINAWKTNSIYLYTAPKIYNMLSLDIKTNQFFNCFKKI